MKVLQETIARAPRADAVRNRRRVLDAARECFAESGLDAQIDEIAALARLGVGTVYRHYPTKDALIVALADDRFERLAELARESLAEDDAWEGFAGFMYRSAELQAADRALSELMASRSEVMSAAAEKSGLFGLVTRLVERAQRDGTLRRDADPLDVPTLICGLGRVTGVGPTPTRSSWKRFLAIVLDGLRAPGHETLPDLD